MQLKFDNIDIPEDAIRRLSPELLEILLKDKTTGKNILWCTTDYQEKGEGFNERDEMTIETVTNKFGKIIQPRAAKSEKIQLMRIRAKAEVFTPSWVCNEQNNLLDEAWFGRPNVFNTPDSKGWKRTPGKISFCRMPLGKRWTDYVKALRLEITCGEAPYLATWYDTTTGKEIPVLDRIGLFDRKMRVVDEHCRHDKKEWIRWSLIALKSVYGYEFQGDSLLIARENLLKSYVDYYEERFNRVPVGLLKKVANIIAWNIWQMDGLKCVVPYSCHEEEKVLIKEDLLLGTITETKTISCPGCEKNILHLHNGIYCKIRDWTLQKWTRSKEITFISLFKKGRSYGKV